VLLLASQIHIGHVGPIEKECRIGESLRIHECEWHSREQNIIGNWVCFVGFVIGVSFWEEESH
jgi:hypothetical protein